ncbi:hypothetical protein Anas_04175 [Armadillidium nasatum]|uniref:Uncharacterized protein n=1 Tax=Armadillidium nasatum TaxID=96803 RepID=A0A5N5T1L6_9CRUS|nr:hypothetical protein Anas_04175 [Armadillidium nasatum]
MFNIRLYNILSVYIFCLQLLTTTSIFLYLLLNAHYMVEIKQYSSFIIHNCSEMFQLGSLVLLNRVIKYLRKDHSMRYVFSYIILFSEFSFYIFSLNFTLLECFKVLQWM